MKRRLMLVLFGGMLLFLMTGCSQSSETGQSSDKAVVAVTIVPEQTFVEAVCGDLVDVVTLVPPGSSPENYEPTPQEMADFSQAELYFTIGVPTEDANILSNIGDVKVVALEDAVAQVYPDRIFEDGGRDPHIWLSPKRVAVMIDTICAQMSELDPENANTYKANAQSYKDQLETVDSEITEALSGVTNKTFIAYHPAFGYLADDYGLTMVALEEEGKEATPQELQAAIDLAKAQNIKVIFYQEEIDSSQSQSFAEELGGRTIQLEPLSADYINNMSNMAHTMAEAMV
ncbi:MAG: zinc transport system substrate-binding protein [Eubacteriaceae bacterium]|nr:zinc transport system substrate-binding protein [Eubacteriaceae bacterium]MDK2962456.1 zinc transport system substrate-binding protein [Eubacteriaceae bacterium]MDN5306916.1 zinc transport system substrate-binding protein [Eubacteriaceae bacterium]